jgi:hypothetical protein
MHIYERAYPKAPTAKIDAPDAPVSEYLKVRKRLGIERCVYRKLDSAILVVKATENWV